MNKITQTAIEEAVIAAYAPMDEVVSIYVNETGDLDLCFYVFTNNQQYDDALMDHLIDAKIPILDAYKELLFDFRFVPLVLLGDARQAKWAAGKDARCVFERGVS